jgi:GntR family transcriptional regulator / MocR family aminotransferase
VHQPQAVRGSSLASRSGLHNSHLSAIAYDHYDEAVKTVAGIHPVIAVQRASATPLYRQIYARYREAIVDGRLRAGERLPSTRSLAAELRISRIPVLNAFEQLLAEGYFKSRVGAGTFVAQLLPEEPTPRLERNHPARQPLAPGARATSRFPLRREPEPWLAGWGAFRVSEPALDEFPFQIWSRLLARHSRDHRQHVRRYSGPMGYAPFREIIAAYLRTVRAVRCDAEQVMVVSGSQQALALSARVLLNAGELVWVEEPGYVGAWDALRMAGARLVPVPVDSEGLDVRAGMKRSRRARAAYLTPSHQYPLGVTMTAARRLQLLDWAQSTGAWIIEDDYDSEYRYESQPISSLQGLDRDARVIYVGTLSKVLFPALRVGYVVVPKDLVARFAMVREASDNFPPTLPQAVLADFIGEGHFARHLRRMRVLYRERRTALVEAIETEAGGALEVMGGEAGLHLVATLAKRKRDRPISESCARGGIWAMPLSSCYLGKPERQGFVLGFSGTKASKMREAVRALCRMIGAD